jgi:hypothetical protein
MRREKEQSVLMSLTNYLAQDGGARTTEIGWATAEGPMQQQGFATPQKSWKQTILEKLMHLA